ncbi:MAG: methionyl-tRNA formyltransferase [Deltaproteobacteria bacterium]|nr:methionyl-tRNA formyltransferase [Deltaproteobacteria bacterium]
MTGRRARIVFMGTPAFAAASLEALIKDGHDIVAAVTQPDKPAGRGQISQSCPVKELAASHGIPVLQPAKVREDGFIAELAALKPEFIAVVAYGKILPPAILSIPPKGCINLHASLLPKYRGAAPINWAIINGEKETGACTMLLDEGMDTGPVYFCEKTPIDPNETAEDLARRLSILGAGLLARTIGLLMEDGLKPTPQEHDKATNAPILKKEDGRINWATDAKKIADHVRGFYPWPGAFTAWKGLLKVHKGRLAGGDTLGASPGTIMEAKETIKVACANGIYEITELQPENKKRMSAADFVKGYRILKGDTLG